VRSLALLLLPAGLVVVLVFVAVALNPKPQPAPPQQATSIVWAGRVFVDQKELARWLHSRGGSYHQWAAQHPALAGGAMTPPAEGAASSSSGGATVWERWSLWLDVLLGTAFFGVMALLVLLIRRMHTEDGWFSDWVWRSVDVTRGVLRRDGGRAMHTTLPWRTEFGWFVAAAGLAVAVVVLLPHL